MSSSLLSPSSRSTVAAHEHSVSELLELIAEKDRALLERDQVIVEERRHRAEQLKLIKLLEEQLRLSNQRRFGASSEKLAYQKGLFDEAELEERLGELDESLSPDAEQSDEAEHPQGEKPARKGRSGFSDRLPRVRIELTLSDEEKEGASSTFFSKVKEELDIVPARAQVLEYWQEKAVFDNEWGESTIKSAARPVHPLGKCIAGTALLAYILIAKYADALPLYRLVGIIERAGGGVNRTTMANWVIRLGSVFTPLIERLHHHQIGHDYLQADETRIQVLKEDGRVATSDKWMWVVRGGPPDQPVVLFHYDPTRSSEVPLRLFDGFKGVLQTDGCPSYGAVCREQGITQIGCWDHARRKFVEATQAAPAKRKGGKVSKAEVAISKELDPEQKSEQRRQLAGPVLEDLREWLDRNAHRVPKDSLTGKAIGYTLNQWDRLVGYLEDGKLHISNALAENAIRPFAVGRKNWLFADTSRGARASATIYSLIETAKANGLEPYDYLLHVLNRIATADTPDKIDALLPWNVNLGNRSGQ